MDEKFSKKSSPSRERLREEVLLRKLGDHYYAGFVFRLLQGIIHNLNGPLQSLYIRSEQIDLNLKKLRSALELQNLDTGQELASRMTPRIEGISQNLDQLNEQLRHLTSNVVPGCRSDVGDIQVNEVIESCMTLLNADMFFKHQVKKTLTLDDRLPHVKARRTNLAVIVLNVAQNALEAMSESRDKHLTIETFTQNRRVIIKIQDTGCGISKENAKEIYKAFFTTKKGMATQDSPGEHAGLGLSIVSLLLRDCDGTIACDSLAGKTTFTVQLPAILNSTDI